MDENCPLNYSILRWFSQFPIRKGTFSLRWSTLLGNSFLIVGDLGLAGRRGQIAKELVDNSNVTMVYGCLWYLEYLPIGSMYAIYGNMDPINIPQMLAYIAAPWILWVRTSYIKPTFRTSGGPTLQAKRKPWSMSDGINDTIGQTSGSVGQFDHWLFNWYTVMPIPGSIFCWSKTPCIGNIATCWVLKKTCIQIMNDNNQWHLAKKLLVKRVDLCGSTEFTKSA